jgi:twitching motility protein PilT
VTNPVYEIPISDSSGVPVASFSAPPPTATFSSPPPTVAPDGTPLAPTSYAAPSAFPPPNVLPGQVAPAAPAVPAGAFPPLTVPAAHAAVAAPPVETLPPMAAPLPPVVAPVNLEAPAAAPLAPAFTVTPADATPASAPAPATPAAPAAAPATVAATAGRHGETMNVEEVASLNPGTGTPNAELIAALQQVLLLGASDLHVSTNSQPLLRIDGGLSPVPGSTTWDRAQVRSALLTLLSPSLLERFEDKLELDFAYTLSNNARFRVNYYQDRGSMGAAFRIIPTRIKTLPELGIDDIVGQFAGLPRGLVLVTGPTGSGKSTTLAALIDLVNETRRDHVVTVEDPIEFLHNNKKSLINQREVGRDTHSFANALKHVLRQDPDVILIGELRDLETISIALTAAETGHLVFATLHTQSAPTTIDRVIDVFPPHQQDQVRTQLAATLQGVVCQTLVKKSNGNGRAVATEVMFANPAISNLVREGKTYQITSVLQSGGASGMHTMDQALAELVNAGAISRASAVEKAQDADMLARLITRVDMGGDSLIVGDNMDSRFGAEKGTRH